MRTNGRSKGRFEVASGGFLFALDPGRCRSIAKVGTDAAWLSWAGLALISTLLLSRPAAAEEMTSQAPLAQSDDEIDWSEEETDELPYWVEEELDEVRAFTGQQGGVQELDSYGSGIPSPEEVMQGGRQQAPPMQQAPAPQLQRGDSAAREFAPPADRVEFSDFRDGLESHGRWADTAEYGRVFIPFRQTQVTGWRPYLYGQWVWTSYGWTWASEEPFGWATYHYGRWAFGPSLGWMWIPGYTWGPAWVVWRHGGGAVGWAPLYPGYLSYTVSYPFHGDHWVFVAPTHFYGHPIHRHWYSDRGSYYHARSTWTRNWRPAGRGGIYSGPPRRYVERTGSVRISQTRVVAVASPDRRGIVSRGSQPRGELRVYRPTNRGSVRQGRPGGDGSNRSGLSAGAVRTAPRTPRVGSGLGSRDLPSETRREIDRPSRSSEVRPTQRAGPGSGAQGRGGVMRSPRSRGSEQGGPRQQPRALEPAPKADPKMREDRPTNPSVGPSARQGRPEQRGAARPEKPALPSSPNQPTPPKPRTKPRSSSSQQLAPSRQSPPSSRARPAPANPAPQPRSSSSQQLAPSRQTPPSSRARPAPSTPGTQPRSSSSQQLAPSRQTPPSSRARPAPSNPATQPRSSFSQQPSRQAPPSSRSQASSSSSARSSPSSIAPRKAPSSQLGAAGRSQERRSNAGKARPAQRP